MVFLRSYAGLVYFHSCASLQSYLDGFIASLYYLHDGRKVVHSLDSVHSDAELRLCLRLPGGKGGFGSNLRAQGNRLSARNRSGNFESCRDLSTGARLRDLQRARIIKQYVDEGGEEREAAEKRRLHLERLERKIEESERRQRASLEKSEAEAIERAHQEALKIEEITLASLRDNCRNRKDGGGRAVELVGAWEGDDA